jgi:hypothetical protein
MLANQDPLPNDSQKILEKSNRVPDPHEHYAEAGRPTASGFSRLQVLQGGKDAGRTLLVLSSTFSVQFCVLNVPLWLDWGKVPYGSTHERTATRHGVHCTFTYMNAKASQCDRKQKYLSASCMHNQSLFCSQWAS